MAKIAIIGAGGFGISLAIAAHQNHHDVTVWDISEEIVSAILRDGEHKTKLPGVPIPKEIRFTCDPTCLKENPWWFLWCRPVSFGLWHSR